MNTTTREQMLKAVISKAVKNGFTPYWKNNSSMVSNKEGFMDTIIESILRDYSQTELLFDHSFAKAFWESDSIKKVWVKAHPKDYGRNIGTRKGYWMTTNGRKRSWKYHLQQAVISDDPLLYYYNHL